MKIEYEQTYIEVPKLRQGRPSFKWTPAVFVIIDGKKIYPPMTKREAKDYVSSINTIE